MNGLSWLDEDKEAGTRKWVLCGNRSETQAVKWSLTVEKAQHEIVVNDE